MKDIKKSIAKKKLKRFDDPEELAIADGEKEYSLGKESDLFKTKKPKMEYREMSDDIAEPSSGEFDDMSAEDMIKKARKSAKKKNIRRILKGM